MMSHIWMKANKSSDASLAGEQKARSADQIIYLSYSSAITAGRCINQLLPKNSQQCSGYYSVYPKSKGSSGKYKVIHCWQEIYIRYRGGIFIHRALCYVILKGRSIQFLVHTFIYVSRQATISHLSSRMLLRDGEYV